MINIKETTNGWIIETTDVRILTAIHRGIKDRIEDIEYLLENGHIRNVKDTRDELNELKQLLEQLD